MSNKCKARQHSDQMVCECGNAWDMNDPSPPACNGMTPTPLDTFLTEHTDDIVCAIFSTATGNGAERALNAFGNPDEVASVAAAAINQTQNNAFDRIHTDAIRYRKLCEKLDTLSVSVHTAGGDWKRITDALRLGAILDGLS